MNQQNVKNSVIEEKLQKLAYDEVSFGIVITLRFYGSLNLKKIAQLIGKPETTTIRHLKQLLEDKIIDIDAEKTASSWGKFYCLTDPVKTLIEKEDEEFEQRGEEIARELADYQEMTEEKLQEVFLREITGKESLEETALRIKYSNNFNSNLKKMIVNSFIEAISKLNKLKKEKGIEFLKKNLYIEPGDLNTTTLFIKYSKAKHIMAIVEKFVEFHREFHQLQKDILDEMDEEGVPENERKLHFVDIFLGTTEFSYKLREE
jgi:hypothetical protein